MLNAGSVRLSGVLEKGFVVSALFVCSGGLLTLLRQENGVVLYSAEGDPVSQAVFLVIYTITFSLIVVWRKRFTHVATRDKLLLLLVSLALVSVLWSAAPEVTLRRGAALVGTTLFGVYLAMRYSLGEQLRLLAWALGIGALLSLLFALALPTYGVMNEPTAEGWRGIYAHKNGLGSVMTLGALVFMLLALSDRRYRWLRWSGFGLSVGLLLLSNSATALIALLTLLVLLPLYRALRWRYTLTVPFLIVAVLLGGGLAMWFLGNEEALLNALGRDATLTDRTKLWPAVIDMIWKHPWLGYGYGGFWLGWEGPSAYVLLVALFDPLDAHSGLLDLWLDLGLLGIAVFVLGFLSAFLRAVTWGARLTRTVEGFWPLIYLTFILLANLTESAILTRNSIFWVLYVAAVLSTFTRRGRAARVNRAGVTLGSRSSRVKAAR